MAVMLTIAFLEWCSFLSWTFWAQVRLATFGRTALTLTLDDPSAVLSELPLAHPSSDNGSVHPNVRRRDDLQCHRGTRGGAYIRCIPHWYVLSETRLRSQR